MSSDIVNFLMKIYYFFDKQNVGIERGNDFLLKFIDEENQLGEANTLQALGDLHIRNDKLSDAEKNYTEALKLFRTIDSKLGEANTKLCIIRLDIINKNINIRNFTDLKEAFCNIGDNEGISDVLQVEMFYNLTHNEFDKASKCFEECLKIREKSKNYLELKMWMNIFHKYIDDKEQADQFEIMMAYIEKVDSLIQN
jgi:tetratricopeptide (TPR) repeat protein